MSAVRSPVAADAAWIGGWCGLSDPWTTRAMVRAGFDWLCLDAQHGTYDDRSLVRTLSVRPVEVPVLVRVRSNDHGLIGRALDAGAAGVIVPLVNSAEDAAGVVTAGRYPPHGTRSWGPLAALTASAGADAARARPALAVMVETPEAVAAVAEIAAVPGLDAVFVGPYDLALSSGVGVEDLLTQASGRAALKRVVTACRDHGIVAGAYAGSLDTAEVLYDLGFTLIAVASDSALFTAAATATAAQARRALDRPAGKTP